MSKKLSLEEMPERCFDFDHAFDWFGGCDDDGNPPPFEVQMAMECSRCGEMLKDSMARMMTTIKNMLDGGDQ